MEGPVFSTRAESQFYCSLGFSVIGMTAIHEAKLAREGTYLRLNVNIEFFLPHLFNMKKTIV